MGRFVCLVKKKPREYIGGLRGGQLFKKKYDKGLYYDLQREEQNITCGWHLFWILGVNLNKLEFQKCPGHYRQVA